MEGKLGKIFLAFFSRLELWITLARRRVMKIRFFPFIFFLVFRGRITS